MPPFARLPIGIRQDRRSASHIFCKCLRFGAAPAKGKTMGRGRESAAIFLMAIEALRSFDGDGGGSEPDALDTIPAGNKGPGGWRSKRRVPRWRGLARAGRVGLIGRPTSCQ